MSAAPFWQTVLFVSCAGLVVLIQWWIQPSYVLQLMLLGPLVAVVGLPHGALDLPIAEHVCSLDSWKSKLVFGLGYLGLAGGVLIVWALVPSAALIAFLAYSALHFSHDWSQAQAILRWTGGVTTIGAPALFHHDEVSLLFAKLAPAAAAGLSADILALAGGLALCVFVIALLVKEGDLGRSGLEQAVLWVSAALLSPLIYFAAYFCCLHSVRHFDVAIRSIPQAGQALWIAALVSALTTFAAVLWALLQTGGVSAKLPDESFRAIFLGLAALTVPHMLLTAQFHKGARTDVR